MARWNDGAPHVVWNQEPNRVLAPAALTRLTPQARPGVVSEAAKSCVHAGLPPVISPVRVVARRAQIPITRVSGV